MDLWERSEVELELTGGIECLMWDVIAADTA